MVDRIAGGFAETAHGQSVPNVERVAWHVGADRVLRAERAFREAIPPIPGSAAIVAVDVIGPRLRAILDNGDLWRAASERPRWVWSATFFERPAPRFTTVHGRDEAGRFFRQEVRMTDAPEMSPALVAAGFARRSLPMEGIRHVAWGVTFDRRLLLIDIGSGAKHSVGGAIPGEEAILSADPFAALVILDSGDVLRWSPRGWYREGLIGAPEQAEQPR